MKLEPLHFFKTILVSLCCLLGISTAQAASYEVFMVRGEVIYEFSGENLEPGTRIASGERVKFGSDKAFAVLVNEGGRYTLSGKNLGDKFQPEKFVTVKKATKKGSSGLRAHTTEVLDSKKKLVNFLESAPFLVLGEAEIKLNLAEYPLDKTHYYYLRYKVAGEFMQATKVLRHHGNTVLINTDEILQGGKKAVRPESFSGFQLYYFGGAGQMKEVCKVDLMLVDMEMLRTEIERLVPIIKSAFGGDGMDQDALKQEILDYLVEYYGRPTEESFEEWVQQVI